MGPRSAFIEASHAVVYPRFEQDWTNDVGRIDQDQERTRPYPYFQEELPRGHLRQLCYEH